MTSTTQLTAEQQRLVSQNIDLARHLAWDACRRSPALDADETLSVAYEALVSVASRFDGSRANVLADGTVDLAGAFSGYARRRINGAILDWQRSKDHVPRRHRSIYKILQAHGHGAGRSVEELAEITGMEPERIRLLIAAVEASPVSLDSTQSADDSLDDGSPLAPKHHSSHSVEGSVLESRIKEAVTYVFDALPETQQAVVALRYYEGMDLASIAAELQVSLTSVRSMHSEAILQLHAAMVAEAS